MTKMLQSMILQRKEKKPKVVVLLEKNLLQKQRYALSLFMLLICTVKYCTSVVAGSVNSPQDKKRVLKVAKSDKPVKPERSDSMKKSQKVCVMDVNITDQ